MRRRGEEEGEDEEEKEDCTLNCYVVQRNTKMVVTIHDTTAVSKFINQD
jgi:hypothetical protein